jgi:uncharacterized protein RhaS with RHS repeats
VHASTPTYYPIDGLGSTMALTDADGDVVNTYDYDVSREVRSQTGSNANQWLFTGEQQDSQVARSPYYLRPRYYDSAIGRFVTRGQL